MSPSEFNVNSAEEQTIWGAEAPSTHSLSIPMLRGRRTAKERRAIDEWLIGASEPIERLKAAIEKVAPKPITILISGETGAGKEVIARAIHRLSDRANKIFVPVNCGAIPENLIEEELFGHVKGSFTGALMDSKGVFEAAGGGTIFLDEIDKTTRAAQVRLLRVLQERKVRQVGAHRERDVDVRVIVATNRDLQRAVDEGLFLQDLYYRIKVVQLWAPPLRERLDDIPLLIGHKLGEIKRKSNPEKTYGFTDGAMRLLCEHTWPGNVRELFNVVEAVTTLAEELLITETEVREALIGGYGNSTNAWRAGPVSAAWAHKPTDSDLREALAKTCGNVSAAARLLKLPRSTFRSRLKRLEQSQRGQR